MVSVKSQGRTERLKVDVAVAVRVEKVDKVDVCIYRRTVSSSAYVKY